MFNRYPEYRKRHRPPLDEDVILSWADKHFEVFDVWPTHKSGPVIGQDRENWSAIDGCLRIGFRGLLPHSSLAILLADRRGVRYLFNRPDLTSTVILLWADEHFYRHGVWPDRFSGQVAGHESESWYSVDRALRLGGRGLPAGSSLLRLLSERLGKPYSYAKEPLTIDQITAWM